MLENQCAVCKKSSHQSCSLCNKVYYCSKQHQKDDWKSHKAACAPFKIQTNDQLGRYLVATRDISEGEVIMKKAPLVCGPKAASFPICLGCHKRINPNREIYTCSHCNWPMCNRSCEDSSNHKLECKIFSAQNYQPQVQAHDSKQLAYAIILPIRALILKSIDKSKYEAITNLQSHLETNINTPLFHFLRMNVVPNIKKLVGCEEHEILNICSIFVTNCFEIRDTEGLVNIRGVYPMVSIMAHDCTVNTKHTFNGLDHQAWIIATTPIKKGDLIKTTYTHTLWCTLSRRAHLRQTKSFDCECFRCRDPTELGMYSGSIYCDKCSDRSSRVISTNPLDDGAHWKCERCSYVITSGYLQALNASLRKEICSIDRSDPSNFQEFLENYENVLHPTNCHVIEVKYAIVQMLGNFNGFRLTEISDENLERKIRLSEELLRIGDVIEPGCSRFREELQKDLQLALNEKKNRNMTDDLLANLNIN